MKNLYRILAVVATVFVTEFCFAQNNNGGVSAADLFKADSTQFQNLNKDKSIKLDDIQPEGYSAESVDSDIDGNGDKWISFENNGVIVSINVKLQRYYRLYYKVQYYICNNSSSPVKFDFTNASIKGMDGDVKLYSYDTFMRSMRRRSNWSAFGLSMAEFAAAAVFDGALNGHYARGYAHRYSPVLDFSHNVSSATLRSAAYIGSILTDRYFQDKLRQISAENVGYIRDYIVNPGCSIQGFAYAEFDDDDSNLQVNVPVGGKVFSFTWKEKDLKYIK